MPEDKQDRIFREIQRRAQEDIKYGELTILLKIQGGKIMAGEIIEQKIKLG